MADTQQNQIIIEPSSTQNALEIISYLYALVVIFYGIVVFLSKVVEEDEEAVTTRIYSSKRPRTRKLLRVLWCIFKVVFWPLVPVLIFVDIFLREWLVPAWNMNWCVLERGRAWIRGYNAVATGPKNDLESQAQNTKEADEEIELEDIWSDDELDELHFTRVLYSSLYAPAA